MENPATTDDKEEKKERKEERQKDKKRSPQAHRQVPKRDSTNPVMPFPHTFPFCSRQYCSTPILCTRSSCERMFQEPHVVFNDSKEKLKTQKKKTGRKAQQPISRLLTETKRQRREEREEKKKTGSPSSKYNVLRQPRLPYPPSPPRSGNCRTPFPTLVSDSTVPYPKRQHLCHETSVPDHQ